MVVGLLGNENPDLNRFTLVTPKPANGVRLQATLDNQNPTGLPVGAVSKEVKQNPKRRQREVKKQLRNTGIGTKSQQALKLQQEQNKQEAKTGGSGISVSVKTGKKGKT